MTEKEVEELAEEYCEMFYWDSNAQLLKKSLHTNNDFKNYLLGRVDWEEFKQMLKEYDYECGRANYF